MDQPKGQMHLAGPVLALCWIVFFPFRKDIISTVHLLQVRLFSFFSNLQQEAPHHGQAKFSS